jgi:acyl carrier protein
MTHDEALTLVKDTILRIVPDADVDHLAPDDNLRGVLELDSLDFLELVETLSKRTGYRIDEDDYPALTTLYGAADFLATYAP